MLRTATDVPLDPTDLAGNQPPTYDVGVHADHHSIWIDPERRLYVILLTNRVHPTRKNNLIREARPVRSSSALTRSSRGT